MMLPYGLKTGLGFMKQEATIDNVPQLQSFSEHVNIKRRLDDCCTGKYAT